MNVLPSSKASLERRYVSASVFDRAKKPTFVQHLHSFRGFAILNIVAIHSLAVSVLFFQPEAPTSEIRRSLTIYYYAILFNATIYFALISGILFTLVLRVRGWKSFYFSKLVNILLPYALFTILFSYLDWTVTYSKGPQLAVFNGNFRQFAETVSANIISGGAALQFWYIPVLMILFVATPLLDLVMRSKWLLLVSLPLLIVPLFLGPLWTPV
jgi:surface polysaccharide O-acyltransferase-like enzyme